MRKPKILRGCDVDKIVVGILTTREVKKVIRCIESVENENVDIVIIVNTSDPHYLKQVQDSCPNYTVIETPCNGTAGKGKQSVLDWFKSTDYDYLLPIDGDDFYNKDGVNYLVRYIKNFEPDVIGQFTNSMTVNGKETTWEDFGQNIVDPEYGWAETSNKKTILSLIKIRDITNRTLPFNRFLALSRKAIEKHSYRTDMMLFEDLLLALELYADSELSYYLVKTRQIYRYDLNSVGVLYTYVNGDYSDTIRPFFDTFEKLNDAKAFIGRSIQYID